MDYFQELSDEALCGYAASGHRMAEEYLVTRYNRLVRMCARPYFLAGGDREDLIQEGMVGLLGAIRSYSSDKKTNFHTYAQRCIQNRIRSAVRSAASGRNVPLNESVPMEAMSVSDLAENPEDLLIDQEELEKRKIALENDLSLLERKVLQLYLTGASQREIGNLIRRSQKSVENAIQRIRRKAIPYFSSGDISVS